MERGWQISSTARINFQFDLPQPNRRLGLINIVPSPPRDPNMYNTFPRRRLAKCELRSKRRPTIRLSAGTGYASSPKAQLGSRPCFWNPHCSNDGEKMKSEKNPAQGECVKYALRPLLGICLLKRILMVIWRINCSKPKKNTIQRGPCKERSTAFYRFRGKK